MNTWQALKKIVRDQFTRPAPEPWTGKHELAYVAFMEDASWPDNYHCGWVWQCSCGVGTNKMIPPRWVNTEEQAVEQFKAHRELYRKLDS